MNNLGLRGYFSYLLSALAFQWYYLKILYRWHKNDWIISHSFTWYTKDICLDTPYYFLPKESNKEETKT